MKLRLKCVKKPTITTRYDLSNIPPEFAANIHNRFEGLDIENQGPENAWTTIKEVFHDATNQHIPKRRKIKRTPWISNEAVAIAAERRNSKPLKNTEDGERRYRKLSGDLQR